MLRPACKHKYAISSLHVITIYTRQITRRGCGHVRFDHVMNVLQELEGGSAVAAKL